MPRVSAVRLQRTAANGVMEVLVDGRVIGTVRKHAVAGYRSAFVWRWRHVDGRRDVSHSLRRRDAVNSLVHVDRVAT